MKHRESFSLKFMQTMLVKCYKARDKIMDEQVEFLTELKDNFGENLDWSLNRLHSCFNPITNKKELVNPFGTVDKAIKALTIQIAKREKLINTEGWERKYEHATEDARIENVARHYLKEDNFRRRVKCPFHESKQGGGKHLQIYEKTNSYHCFSCKASGNPIDFVISMDNCEFKEAVEVLQNF